jgi:hypothetical protein
MSTCRIGVKLSESHGSVRNIRTGGYGKIDQRTDKFLKEGFDVIVFDIGKGSLSRR